MRALLYTVTGVHVAHHRQVEPRSWPARYLSPREICCRHCNALYVHRPTLAAFDRARAHLGAPLTINSGHRCTLHNARIGGAPLSAHLLLALDVSTRGHERGAVYRALQHGGFTGMGMYRSFIHVDLGRRRTWFGSTAARELWQPLLALDTGARP